MSGLDVLKQAAAGDLPVPPVGVLLGWKPRMLAAGRALIEYTASEQFYNPSGTVQGGILAAMLDDAMGPAALTVLDEGEFAPTIEMKVNFLRPAYAGKLLAQGRLVHRTGGLVFMEGSLSTEDGRLIATATATGRIIRNGATNGHASVPVRVTGGHSR